MNSSEWKLKPVSLGPNFVKSILEVRRMCYLRTKAERDEFISIITESVGHKKLSEIPKELHQEVFDTARSILLFFGESIICPKSRLIVEKVDRTSDLSRKLAKYVF